VKEEFESDAENISLYFLRRIDDICLQFEAACKIQLDREPAENAAQSSDWPQIEKFLSDWQEPERTRLFLELLYLDIEYCRQNRQVPVREEYSERFPNYRHIIETSFPRNGDTWPAGPQRSTSRPAISANQGNRILSR
jgi:hypothetical protein